MERNYQYCQDEKFLTNIEAVLSTAFAISDFSVVSKKYDALTKIFYGGKDSLQTININRNNFLPITNDATFIDNFLSPNFMIGVDLPVFISNDTNVGRTIMVLGEDPLRNEMPVSGEIILSTPYGTHHPSCRSGRQKIYWVISKVLLSLGYSIYYTDINKVWLKELGKNKKQDVPFDLKEQFTKCLENEIAAFNPEIIITFGKPAEQATKCIKESSEFYTPIVQCLKSLEE